MTKLHSPDGTTVINSHPENVERRLKAGWTTEAKSEQKKSRKSSSVKDK